MYYVVSNSDELLQLAEQKNWGGLLEEFKESKLIVPETYKGQCFSARELYRKICEMISEAGEMRVDEVSEVASKVFADAWDVEALLLMKSSPAKFGKMHEDAEVVLKEYEHYKELALAEFDANSSVASFEKEIGAIKIVYMFGRLSFYKDNMEYFVFRNDSY